MNNVLCFKCLKVYNIDEAPRKSMKKTLVKVWNSDGTWKQWKFPVCPYCNSQWYFN